MEKNTKVWFTSDTHFGGQRTLELSKRPFKTVDEMNKMLIDNWNSKVSKDDVVFHLGDFGDYNIVNKLNGNVNLVLGNYERCDINKIYNQDVDAFESKLKELGFNEIFLDDTFFTINNENIKLIHEPERYSKTHFNLFGHIHKLCMVKKFGLNVGCDCHNYSPIDIETVLYYKNAIEKFYDNNVFMYE